MSAAAFVGATDHAEVTVLSVRFSPRLQAGLIVPIVLVAVVFVAGCNRELEKQVTPPADQANSPMAPSTADAVDVNSLLAEFKPGDRPHPNLAEHASKVGYITFGGSGSGLIFYRIGTRTVAVLHDGGREIESMDELAGTWPREFQLGNEPWMDGLVIRDDCPPAALVRGLWDIDAVNEE